MKHVRNTLTLSPQWWHGKTHILIDMDGTLIKEPGFIFLNLFRMAAIARLSSAGKLTDVIRSVRKVEKLLLSPNHGFESIQEAFFETLASHLKITRDRVEKFTAEFFYGDYPLICLFLHSEPDARRLIDTLHALNKHTTLATNAVFGNWEIEMRLRSSNLYLHDFDYVTSWDQMKSLKPNASFFEEVMAKIGAKPENTVMIGNDPYYDLPAYKLGIQTLLVGNKLSLGDIADSLEPLLNK